MLCGRSRGAQDGLPKDSGAPAQPGEDMDMGWGPRERGMGQMRAHGYGGLGGARPNSADTLLPGPGHQTLPPLLEGPSQGTSRPPGPLPGLLLSRPPTAGSGGAGPAAMAAHGWARPAASVFVKVQAVGRG